MHSIRVFPEALKMILLNEVFTQENRLRAWWTVNPHLLPELLLHFFWTFWGGRFSLSCLAPVHESLHQKAEER